jgi:hypothetical protein
VQFTVRYVNQNDKTKRTIRKQKCATCKSKIYYNTKLKVSKTPSFYISKLYEKYADRKNEIFDPFKNIIPLISM